MELSRSTPARILHVHSGNLYGGVETMLRTIARHQAGVSGVEHRFALCFEGQISGELRAEGSTVYKLPAVKTRWPWTIHQARRELRSIIERERIQVAVCHMPWALAIFGSACRQAGAELVFWAHDIHRGSHWLERWASRQKPALALVNSQVTAQGVRTMFPKLPSRLLHCPVELPFGRGCASRAEKRAELGVKDDQAVILQVSRIEPWKGHHLHLRALATLLDRNDWVCWMVGGAQRPAEQEHLARLHKQARSLGLASRVKFLGQRHDVHELMQASDIFCQANAAPEPFGMVFVEALGAGLPVVTFAMGGPAEIVDQTCGLLAPPEDIGELAYHLRSLVASPSLRRVLGGRGPQRARQLSDPAQQLTRLELFLNEAYQNERAETSR
jgi:glycosyltransferase involved in cell wall biosynthesis